MAHRPHLEHDRIHLGDAVTACTPRKRGALRWRGAVADLARTRRSAVSLELAAVALPFFVLLLGTMEVAYDLYVQAALNYVVSETANDIWEGNAQASSTGSTPLTLGSNFVANYMCPHMSGLLDCSLVSVNIEHIPSSSDFWATKPLPYLSGNTLSTGSWSVCTGGPQASMLFQAVYAGPTFVGGLIPAFAVKSSSGGGLVHPTYSSQAWINQSGFVANVSC